MTDETYNTKIASIQQQLDRLNAELIIGCPLNISLFQAAPALLAASIQQQLDRLNAELIIGCPLNISLFQAAPALLAASIQQQLDRLNAELIIGCPLNISLFQAAPALLAASIEALEQMRQLPKIYRNDPYFLIATEALQIAVDRAQRGAK
jgi:hypothetical protein